MGLSCGVRAERIVCISPSSRNSNQRTHLDRLSSRRRIVTVPDRLALPRAARPGQLAEAVTKRTT